MNTEKNRGRAAALRRARAELAADGRGQAQTKCRWGQLR